MPQTTYKPRRKPYYRRPLFALVSLLIVVGLGTLGYFRFHKNSASTVPIPGTPPASTKSQVNLAPPTDAQKNPAMDSTSTNSSSTMTSNGKKSVTPVITKADQNGAKAFVPNIIEDGGTCTATFTHGADKITATSTGVSNVSYTTCPSMNPSGPINIPGTWTVIVSYSSSAYSGQSQPSTFEVK